MNSTLNISVFYPVALRMAKTPWSFGHSECNRVKASSVTHNIVRENYILATIGIDKMEIFNIKPDIKSFGRRHKVPKKVPGYLPLFF